MKSTVVVCGLLLLAPITGGAQGNIVEGTSRAQLQVDGLAAKLVNREIGRVEVLQIPARVLTRIRITPEMLEKQFHYRLTIQDIRGAAHESELVRAVKSIAVEARTDTADLRWGLILYGVDEARVGAFYFDKTGRYGAVGGTPVSFKGNFFKWLDDNFSGCFR